MLAYTYDNNGYLNGITQCQPNPREENAYLLPAMSTVIAPPTVTVNKIAKWDGSIWSEVEDPEYTAAQAILAIDSANQAIIDAEEAVNVVEQNKQILNQKIVVIYDTSDDNKVIAVGSFNSFADAFSGDTEPRFPLNGLLISDSINANLEYLEFDPGSEPVGAADRNTWYIALKKIDSGSVVDRAQVDIDADSDPIALSRLRDLRDQKLLTSDWTRLDDVPLTQQQVIDYATYRQELRDLPANTVDPKSPTWPSEPS